LVDKLMRWLIVEDALRDRKGHWFEYVGSFVRELGLLGDEVVVLADRSAEPFLKEQLDVRPVLPDSIWHRMGDGAGAARRYLRVPAHAWNTSRAVRRYLKKDGNFDVIFVPTVLVHHLLGWMWLIKGALKKTKARVVLFFPNTPIQLCAGTGKPEWQPAPTAKLFHRLLRSLKREVEQGRVILAAETQPMRQALTQLSGVPFTYFPHPVAPVADHAGQAGVWDARNNRITMGSYGSARHEKGSDVLVNAVDEYTRRYPDSRIQFVLQCVEGDKELWKRLEGNPKVRLVPDYFGSGGYARQLLATDVLLLPYRRSSYGLRVSRVVIEALVHGLPVVATRGTTLADQAAEFGAATFCEDGSAESLVKAIREMEQGFAEFRRLAESREDNARRHFSVSEFRGTLLLKHRAE
jgi:glycosyltransferase involved in cell wall biosynthesis